MVAAGSGKKIIDGMLLVKNAMRSRNQNARKNEKVKLKGTSSPIFFAHHLKVR
jgi:hypothetical protein